MFFNSKETKEIKIKKVKEKGIIVFTRNDCRLSASSHLFPILLFFLNIFFLLKRLLLDFFLYLFLNLSFNHILNHLILSSFPSPPPILPLLHQSVMTNIAFSSGSSSIAFSPYLASISSSLYFSVNPYLSLFLSLSPSLHLRQRYAVLTWRNIKKPRSLPQNQSDWVA